MNFQNFRQNPGCFVGIAVLCFFVASATFAQEGVTVSGRVVNEAGDAVAGISIAIQPYKAIGNRRQEGIVPLWERQTDAEGNFSIWPITPMESVRFVLKGAPGEQTEIQILSIKMDEITFYPNDHPHPPFNLLQFSLAAGTEIEDAVITVKTSIRPQVRARVIFADGTPVANASIRVRMIRKDLDGSGSGSSSGGSHTDHDGYFVEDLRVDNSPQFYRLGVEHQGLLAKAPAFILHEGQPQIHLLLKLNGNPIPLAERPPPMPHTSDAALTAFMNPPSVWIVNPANGHAYKMIYCENIMEAMEQAEAENAYLVSINDAAENEWLQGIFERENFWIGLSDAAEEGQWVWHSGEPVTYTDWGEQERDSGNTEMKDHVIMLGFHNATWRMAAPGDGHANFTKRAVIEKAEPPVETSPKGN